MERGIVWVVLGLVVVWERGRECIVVVEKGWDGVSVSVKLQGAGCNQSRMQEMAFWS